ncbi:hypothetical protein NVP1017O_24 [Vibrio phage 1.017.O._10N.286.55.C11]|nr:hypothetical protein NVP1017O_24 [Vibrio phage 1.017.O._10N.286.55.C11]AUR85456.1 hypothetical protein NVP1075O_24 [Vibrio phage 1.075.O._10N.286.55.B10]AUR87002.1 hypothetical protein NVP1093O_24 [Vibrio phage 1.093.O._10N.286.55.E10]AUR87075.1 hypothetical protein NVP1094O_24 [Vibrio phage 1.094.O._10N.286.55.E12]
MSVFKCQGCGCKENTACCNFHILASEGKKALCSECDPKIGKWHGRFKKSEFVEPYDRDRHGSLPLQYQHEG